MSPSRSNPTSDDAPVPSPEEAEEDVEQAIIDLPPREALSIVDPGAFGLGIPLPIGKPGEAVPGAPTDAEPVEPTT